MKIHTTKNGMQRIHQVIISDNGDGSGVVEPELYLEIDKIYDYYK